MSMRRWMACCGAVCVAALAGSALAQDGQAEPGAQEGYDPQAEMQKWIELGKPGEEHKNLEYMIGTWKTTVRHWMEPGSEAETSTGTAKAEWVLDGRFVRSEYTGQFMDGPFNGIGFTGYDKLEKKYTSVWMDSMSTSPMIDRGTYDASKKEFTYESTCKMPEGGEMHGKTIIKIESPDKYIMTMYHQMPGMTEMVKAMEITFERTGGARG